MCIRDSTYTTAVIPAGENATYVLAGYLPETVDNLYQGKHYHGLLTLNAYQVDTDEGGNPDEGGDSSTPAADPYTVTIHFSDPQDAEATVSYTHLFDILTTIKEERNQIGKDDSDS